jgi:Protein of unknown function (DUF3251)
MSSKHAVISAALWFAAGAWAQPSAEDLAKEVAALKKEVADLKARYASAQLDPAAPNKYESLQTPAGLLLVSVSKVERQADGYKVQLSIGNPVLTTFKGFRLSVSWGPRGQKKIKSQEFPFTKTLVSGHWNSVSLVLPDTKPEDFGALEVSIDVDSLSLLGR